MFKQYSTKLTVYVDFLCKLLIKSSVYLNIYLILAKYFNLNIP